MQNVKPFKSENRVDLSQKLLAVSSGIALAILSVLLLGIISL